VTVDLAIDGVSIFAKVSLLNMLTYNVSLARSRSVIHRKVTRGHFFDTSCHQIIPLANKNQGKE
jgi:hypothetical protein